jgi:rod shape-determining protein MreC
LFLLSKIKSKYLGLIFLFFFLFFLPFKSFWEGIFLFFSQKLTFYSNSHLKKIKELEKKNLLLLNEIKRLEHLKKENESLRKALNLKEEKEIDILGVEIISFSPSLWQKTAVINKGKKEGINKGDLVINEEGFLVGKVIEVEQDHSRIIFINDFSFTLPVFVGEDFYGLLKGGWEKPQILYIETDKEVKIKDKVWVKLPTINLPIYIGEVEKVKKNKNSLFLNVRIKFFVKNPLLHHLFVIKYR